MKDESKFVVGKGKDLVERFNIKQREWKIELADIPVEFQHLIPLLKYWAVSDDTLRSRVVDSATEIEKFDFIEQVEPLEDEIYSWLAGPEARGPSYSDGYIAFSDMMMALDLARM